MAIKSQSQNKNDIWIEDDEIFEDDFNPDVMRRKFKRDEQKDNIKSTTE